MSNANTIFSREFAKTVGGFLSETCATGVAVTRPELARVIRKAYGRKMTNKHLTAWLSASVNLGLFDTTDQKFITKRGVSGGIVMKGAAARVAAEASQAETEVPAPAPRKARKAAQPAAL